MDIYIWLLTCCIVFTSIEALSCNRDAKCKISRVHGMKGADCYDKDMRTFSQCLPSDVEVIDLSKNRIRKLTADDLKKYTSLRILYLFDNTLVTIDEETFENMDYLQTLDLSLNALRKVPPVIFHLPSLQSLYLGNNLNMNIVDVVEKSKPLTSPLFHLDISNIMFEDQDKLPDLGVLSTLKKYNISGNKLTSITARNFAGLCSLEILDTTNVSIEYEEDNWCDCWIVNRWLKNRKVLFKPFECHVDESECMNGGPTKDDLKLYDTCMEQIEENLRKSKLKTAMYIATPILVVLAAVILYFIIRRRRAQKRKQRKDQAEETMLNNAITKKM